MNCFSGRASCWNTRVRIDHRGMWTVCPHRRAEIAWRLGSTIEECELRFPWFRFRGITVRIDHRGMWTVEKRYKSSWTIVLGSTIEECERQKWQMLPAISSTLGSTIEECELRIRFSGNFAGIVRIDHRGMWTCWRWREFNRPFSVRIDHRGMWTQHQYQ